MAKNPYFDEDGNEPTSTPRPGKSALPDWAQITADLNDDSGDDFDTPPAPAAPITPPATPTPQKPARPAAPKPPVQQPASVPVPQTPPVAVPTPAVQPPVAVPAPAPTPTPAPAPVSAPEVPAEPRQPDRSSRKPRQARAVPEPTLPSPRPEPQPAPESTKRSGRNIGGRWKVIALRVAVWGAIGMIFFVGLFTIIGPKGPNLTTLTDKVTAAIGDNGFPFEAGSQMAMRFAEEFYTVDPSNPQARDARLLKYFPSGDPLTGASLTYTSDKRQIVINGPYVAGEPELISKSHVVFTVALQVQNPGEVDPQTKQPVEPRWIYAAVPVTVDKAGNLAITGLPSVVPDPAIGDGGESYSFDTDSTKASEAKASVERYLALWAASDTTGLEPYLQSGESTWAARSGLNNFVEFGTLAGLTVEALPSNADMPATCTAPDFGYPCRKATATVIWKQNGGTFTQTYRMVLFNEGQYWRVLDIKGSTW